MASALVEITVNGKSVKAPAGELLIHVLREQGIEVPTLCHDERLTPYGGCRLCVVDRKDGRGGMVPACSTPVSGGMVVETDTSGVHDSRRRQLQLLVANHRMDCPVCERRGDCRLQDLIYRYGTPGEEVPFELVEGPRDTGSPVIERDPEKCVLCGKCVRLCDEVQSVAAIGLVHRGLSARVATHDDKPLDCEFCGQCVNACPVGALVAPRYVSDTPVWMREKSTTTCSFCSCGCQVDFETSSGRILRVASSEESKPNAGKLCVKGWLGWDIMGEPERLTRPLVRKDDQLVEATWEEALDAVVRAFSEARSASREIVGIGSARLANEDAYLFQRLIRGALSSPHVSVGPTGGVDELALGLGAATGLPRSSAGWDEVREADLVFVLRADPTRTHPLVKTELVEGARRRGQKLVIAHALSGGLDKLATKALLVAPGSEPALLGGVAACMATRDEALLAALSERPGFEEWKLSLEAHEPSMVKAASGVEAADVEALVDLLVGAEKVVFVVVTGIGVPGDGVATTRAAAALSEMLGSKSSGVMLLGELANAQGVVDAGMHPAWLPGARPVSSEAARHKFSEAWGVPIPEREGWRLAEALEHARQGDVGALYLAGQDPAAAWASSFCFEEVRRAVPFLVVQEAFLTATARQADVVLPVAILAERAGTLTGADGRRRPLAPSVQPPSGVPQDGMVFAELAKRLGHAIDTDGVEEMAINGDPRVGALPELKPQPPTAAGEGFLFDRSPQLFHSGGVTARSAALQELSPTVALRLAPEDAERLGVRGGEPLRVTGSGREILLRARVDESVRPRTAVSSWHGTLEGVEGCGDFLENPLFVDIRRS